MRKHLAAALKTRLKSIQAAIEDYNKAASSLSPPCQSVTWEEVLEYTYLSEFDILRDTREDVRERKWATPKNRLLMQQFFKMIGAEDELDRLHTEIRRFLTSMRDEEEKTESVAQGLRSSHPALALAVRLQGQQRSRFNSAHRAKLHAIKKLPGFEKRNLRFFTCGTSVWSEDIAMEEMVPEDATLESGGSNSDNDELWEDPDEVEHQADMLLEISVDSV